MSLINQVLSDLEKRGATMPGETSIRVVHTRKNRAMVALLLATVLASVFVAVWLWWSGQKPGKTIARTAANPAPTLAGSKLPAVGIPPGGASMVPASANPAAEPQAESLPVALATREIPPEESRQTDEWKAAGAATRLSFELSSIPLPSTLRAKPVATVAGQRHDKAALPEHKISTETGAARSDPSAVKYKTSGGASAVAPAGVDKQIKQASAQQQADNEFRRASGLMQQGRASEALAGYEAALQFDVGHDDARLAMLGLLLENKRNADAERVLQDGLKHNPKQSGFAMLLARLQVERNDLALALDTLQKTLPYAYQQADYQAFIAALLQRQNRHQEAISRYQFALQLSPNSGVWLMGLGISLQAERRNEEARDAFKRAIASRTMNAELQAFIEQRLKEL